MIYQTGNPCCWLANRLFVIMWCIKCSLIIESIVLQAYSRLSDVGGLPRSLENTEQKYSFIELALSRLFIVVLPSSFWSCGIELFVLVLLVMYPQNFLGFFNTSFTVAFLYGLIDFRISFLAWFLALAYSL